MPRAWCLIREQPAYRREAFAAGLAAAGFAVECQDYARCRIPFAEIGADDALVVWNRYGTVENLAREFEARRGRVLVAENGYLGADAEGRQHYSLAVGGHNGSGRWHVGGPERWERLGIEIGPWRRDGAHVLVCPNRPFGPRGLAMHSRWGEECAARLRMLTRREVRLRPHPGNWQRDAATVREGLMRDLDGAWACVIWASSAGLHALLAGIPVICEAPSWIARRSAFEADCAPDAVDVASPWMRMGADATRLETFRALAWHQWTVDELAGGEPFRLLMAL